jgi:hypothetical protein
LSIADPTGLPQQRALVDCSALVTGVYGRGWAAKPDPSKDALSAETRRRLDAEVERAGATKLSPELAHRIVVKSLEGQWEQLIIFTVARVKQYLTTEGRKKQPRKVVAGATADGPPAVGNEHRAAAEAGTPPPMAGMEAEDLAGEDSDEELDVSACETFQDAVGEGGGEEGEGTPSAADADA